MIYEFLSFLSTAVWDNYIGSYLSLRALKLRLAIQKAIFIQVSILFAINDSHNEGKSW